MTQKLVIEAYYDSASNTFSYLLYDQQSLQAAIIDSVLDFEVKSGRTKTESADQIIDRAHALDLQLLWHLETHVHADHLSAAPYLQSQLGGQIAIGEQVLQIQQTFGELFNLGKEFSRTGSQFDRLLADGEALPLGAFKIDILHTPGHTPACASYIIDDGERKHVFVGDTLFMPDYGTARCDFPGGSAGSLYASIQKILALPPNSLLYMCHDYPPSTRSAQYLSTVGEQLAANVHIHRGVSREQFVAMRQQRDAGLSMPALILPSVQVNMRAGYFPPAESNGLSYLKIPLNGI